MKRTSSSDVNRDWSYSDGFLEHAKTIIGEHLLVAAPMQIDCQEACDFIYLVSGRGDVAFRVRRPAYIEKYGFDVTFRALRNEKRTELDKILDGNARWMLYGFGAEDGKMIQRWVLLDLNAFRAAILRGQVQRKPVTSNGDGTGFEAFDTRLLRGADASIIAAANHEIPLEVIPTQRESKRDFWRRMGGA